MRLGRAHPKSTSSTVVEVVVVEIVAAPPPMLQLHMDSCVASLLIEAASILGKLLLHELANSPPTTFVVPPYTT